jgi:hypothetical protein
MFNFINNTIYMFTVITNTVPKCRNRSGDVKWRLFIWSKLRYTGPRSVAARPPHRLCYRPAIFSCHLPLIVLWLHKETSGALVTNVTNPIFLRLLKLLDIWIPVGLTRNCVSQGVPVSYRIICVRPCVCASVRPCVRASVRLCVSRYLHDSQICGSKLA